MYIYLKSLQATKAKLGEGSIEAGKVHWSG